MKLNRCSVRIRSKQFSKKSIHKEIYERTSCAVQAAVCNVNLKIVSFERTHSNCRLLRRKCKKC